MRARGGVMTVSGVARRPSRAISPVFLALLTMTVCAALAVWRDFGNVRFAVFLFVVGGWMVLLCLHEFAHALTAYRGGDHTVADKGYLTLNPFRYGHVVLTLLFPILALLWGGVPLPGGAVWVDGRLLRTRARDSLVSAAGPMVNLVSAVVLLEVVAKLGPAQVIVVSTGGTSYMSAADAFWAALAFLAYTQVVVTLLNLLPVPGLDGYGIIEPWLPARLRRALVPVQPFLLLVVLALLFTHPVGAQFQHAAEWIGNRFGVDSDDWRWGYQLTKFWQ
jgi:Zn-dependent protease